MTPRMWQAATAVLVAGGVTLHAAGDRVLLRSGKAIEGMFIGADSRSIRVLLDDGSVSEIALADASGVEFTARPRQPQPATQAAARTPPAGGAATAPPARTAVTIPAGTTINVRLSQAIDVDVSRAGQTFKAIVDDPVHVGGRPIVPRGASAVLQAVTVAQSGTMKGSDRIALKLNAVGFGGMVYDVSTTHVEAKGKGEGRRTARKIGGGAGLGAIVGGIAGGGEGAAIGAAIGGATGAAVAAGGEEHLKLPAETRLQFQLTAAVAIR